MKRIEKKALYDILSQCKTGAMEKETLKQFVLMRLELRKFYEEFEQARTAFSEDTKPDGWKDGDDVAEWNKRFNPIMNDWLEDEGEVINTNVLSFDAYVDFISANELSGIKQDLLYKYLVKDDLQENKQRL